MKYAAAFLIASTAIASAQTPTDFKPNTAISSSGVNSAFGSKLDLSKLGQPNGPAQLDGAGALDSQTITNPAISGGTISVQATGASNPRLEADRAAEIVNVLDFGPRGTVCTGGDDTAALQAAFTAASNPARPIGAKVQLPALTCSISATLAATITGAQNFVIRGHGKSVSILKVTAAVDGIDLNIAHTGTGVAGASVELSDFSLMTTASVTTGVSGIKLTGTGTGGTGGGSGGYTTLKNLQIGNGASGQYFFNGVDIEQLASVNLEQLNIRTGFDAAPWLGNAVLINGGDASHPYTNYVLTDIRTQGAWAVGINLTNNLQGIEITRPQIIGQQDGIDYISAIRGATLAVHGGVINTTDYGVHTSGVNGVTVDSSTQIFGLFTPVASVQWFGVYIDNAGYSSVSGITVGNLGGTTGFVTNGIYLDDTNHAAGSYVSGNKLSLLTGFGIKTAASAASWPILVQNNSVLDVTTPFLDTTPAGQTHLSGNCFSTAIQGCGQTPTLSSCGTGSTLSAYANSDHGTVTEGSATTTCAITMHPAPTAVPDCVVTSPSGTVLTSYSVLAGALTLSHASATGVFTYHCAPP